MNEYREEQLFEGATEYIVKTNEDGTESWIPKDPINSDYQAYLEWLENDGES
jgi:secreted PhoX family phosphatase